MGLRIAFINFNLRTKSLAHSINVSGAKILVVGQGKFCVQRSITIQFHLRICHTKLKSNAFRRMTAKCL